MLSFQYISVPFFIALGLIAQRIPVLNLRLTPVANRFVIWLAIPALILDNIPKLDISGNALLPMLTAWALMLLSIAIFVPVGRALKWQPDITAVVILLTGLGNTAFLGISVVGLALGEPAIPIAILYDQLGSFLMLSIVATSLIGMLSTAGGEPRIRIQPSQLLGKLLCFPPFAILILAFFIPSPSSLSPAEPVLQAFGFTILPLAMLILGMQLHLKIDRQHLLPIALALVTKLLLFPTLVFLVLVIMLPQFMEVTPPEWQAILLQSAMPPMITPVILLISANLAPRLATSLLSLGTLAAFITLPTIALLIR